MSTIAVTGAGGFIGRHLVRALSATGHDPIALLRRPDPAIFADLPGIKLRGHPPDLTSGALASLLEGTDVLVHAAATSPAPGIEIGDFVRDNVLTTQTLLAAARQAGVGRLIFLSAISGFGRPSAAELTEETASTNPDAYGLSKRLAEAVVAEAISRHDIEGALILRLPGVVGPGMRDPWLGRLARDLLRRKNVAIYNPLSPFNNAVHVDTAIHFISAIAERIADGLDHVNIAAGGPLPIAEVAEGLRQRLGSRSTVEVRTGTETSFTISTRRAEERYGFAPQDMQTLLDRLAVDVLNEQA
jgi:nucleoside-diphosphate-sugar epimerase